MRLSRPLDAVRFYCYPRFFLIIYQLCFLCPLKSLTCISCLSRQFPCTDKASLHQVLRFFVAVQVLNSLRHRKIQLPIGRVISLKALYKVALNASTSPYSRRRLGLCFVIWAFQFSSRFCKTISLSCM